MSAGNCTHAISFNADIWGIGVRTAVYIQNLAGFIPAISALRDGEVASYELAAIETQSTTILITAFALVISAIVQARIHKLTIFDGNIILSLSWMNNTNTFIYFLLYVLQRAQAGPQNISSWWMDVKDWFAARITFADDESEESLGELYNVVSYVQR
ncbi:hypothetical protein GGX14DRAFT_524907 [Mycena pura]|uniref:Uncharacterized protein n=1 Tax=Mycena pura TaxID=153505 RepID=A0AAD6Y761_9AGAR|nr:hypothetical protein GGX14DRAFT_524907 [Mycena pura]